jgi:hypothetical protein
MTNTVTSANGSHHGSKPRPKRAGKKSAIGEHKHKRTGIDVALGLLTPLVGQEFLDKYGLRDPLNRTLRYGTRTIFSTAGATGRQFKRVQNLRGGPTRLKTSGKDYYDLTPDDDQLTSSPQRSCVRQRTTPTRRLPIPRTWSRRPPSWGSPRSTFPRTSTASPRSAPA